MNFRLPILRTFFFQRYSKKGKVCAQDLSDIHEDDSFKHPKIISLLKIHSHNAVLLSHKVIVYCYSQTSRMPAVMEVYEPQFYSRGQCNFQLCKFPFSP